MWELRTDTRCVVQGKSPAEYPELALPKPNEFIPINLEIKNKQVVAEVRSGYSSPSAGN